MSFRAQLDVFQWLSIDSKNIPVDTGRKLNVQFTSCVQGDIPDYEWHQIIFYVTI